MTAGIADPWLRTFQRTDRARTVVCFPHAGGTANYFRAWGGLMPAGTGLTVVQYPGRADRTAEARVEDIGTMADRIASALSGVPGQVVLFGHSLGAAVAHEVAARMDERSIAALVVSAHPGPGDMGPVTEHLMPDDELWRSVMTLNGTDDVIAGQDAFRDLLVPIFRSDFRVASSYRNSTPRRLTVPVLACVGDHDPEVPAAQIDSWRHVTTGPFETRIFTGDHFYINPSASDLLPVVTGYFR